MRRIFQQAGITAAGIGLLLGATAANALDPYQTAPEPRAYLSMEFGGHTSALDSARSAHAGLRLDHDRFLNGGANLPPLLQLDFARQSIGMNLNGLNVAQHRFLLRQEGQEQEGIGSGGASSGDTGSSGSSTGGDAGSGGDSGSAAAGTGGGETTYSFVDWIIIGVGVAAIGVVGAKVISGSDDPTPSSGGTTPAGGCPAGTLPNPLPVGPPCSPAAFVGATWTLDSISENQAWLDSGTGQMGDLQ